ncbi:hypothetical protein CDCA_CDCA03G1078 [Cyanidium caldarium]|uniref:FHA domain-containing protein n=1 Tax=Cyanidium caldarium TaxID=2771 RepID=A0AAV9IT57_CYACA|nr:hypothetical protein CDCA_CDCA03G1078 [Cyanidium caldarium]
MEVGSAGDGAVSAAPSEGASLTAGGYAKLFLKVFDTGEHCIAEAEYIVRRSEVVLGRSASDVPERFLEPVGGGADVGVGFSNKLSRRHAIIAWSRERRRFELTCLGKNGVLVAHAGGYEVVRPESAPVPLSSFTLLLLGDCVACFLLPSVSADGEHAGGIAVANGVAGADAITTSGSLSHAWPPPPSSAAATAPAAPGMAEMAGAGLYPASGLHVALEGYGAEEWSKIDTLMLQKGMTRFGFGRWHDIAAQAEAGRLDRKTEAELVLMGRRIVIQAALHVTGAEREAMLQLLRLYRDPSVSPEQLQQQIEAETAAVAAETPDTEHRKYVRWARRFRLMHRIGCIAQSDAILQRLERGELTVPCKPPCDAWTAADDADLVRGLYRHGYGDLSKLYDDQELGFHLRFAPPAPVAGPPPAARARRSGSGSAAEAATDEGEDAGDDADEDEEEEERGGTEVANASGVEGSAASAEVAVEAPDAVEPRHEGAPTATAGTDGGLPPFPSSLDLGKRVRSIAKVGARYFETRRGGGDAAARHRQAGDGADGDGGGKPAGTQRQPKTPEQKQAEALERLKRLQPFSKKDVRDMERLVVNYGTDFCPDAERSPQRMLPLPLHDWSRFVTRIQAMQFKFPETLEDMFIELMRECYRVLATPRGETGGAAAAADMLEMEACAAPPDDDEDGSDDDDEEDAIGTVDAEAATTTSFPNSSPADVDPPEADALFRTVKARCRHSGIHAHILSQAATFPPSTVFLDVSREYARKAIYRVHFFTILRVHLLPCASLAELVRLAPPPPSKNLPAWWRSAHDRALLYGIDRHGVGLGAFERMARDRELGFPQSIENYCARSRAGMSPLPRQKVNFPKVKVALRRAKTVMEAVCEALHAAPYPYDPAWVDETERTRRVAHFRALSEAQQLYARLATQLREQSAVASASAAAASGHAAEASATDDASIGQPDAGSSGIIAAPASALTARGGVRPRRRGRRAIYEELIANGWLTRGPQLTDDEMSLRLPCELAPGLVLLALGDIVTDTRLAPAFHDEQHLLPIGLRTARKSLATGRWYETTVECAADRPAPRFRVREVEFQLPPVAVSDAVAASGTVTVDDIVVPVSKGFHMHGDDLGDLWMTLGNTPIETGYAPGEVPFVRVVSGMERAGLHDPNLIYCLQQMPRVRECCPRYRLRDFTAEGGGGVVSSHSGLYDTMMKMMPGVWDDSAAPQPFSFEWMPRREMKEATASEG